MSEPHGETFEEFRRSFYYGSRSDLHFKFLASLSDENDAEFVRQLLETLGDVFDTGRYGRVRELVYDWQVRAYAGEAKYPYDDGPFAVPRNEVAPRWAEQLGADEIDVCLLVAT